MIMGPVMKELNGWAALFIFSFLQVIIWRTYIDIIILTVNCNFYSENIYLTVFLVICNRL